MLPASARPASRRILSVVRLLGLAILVGGCGFNVGGTALDAGEIDATNVDPDAPIPDAPDAPPICASWHPAHFMPCMIGTPKPPVTITASGSPWTYNTTVMGGVLSDKTNTVLTSNVVVMQSDNTMVAVLNVDGLVVEPNATLYVIGEKPLIIASWSTIVVTGTIDAGSSTFETNAQTHVDGPLRTGAGANRPAGCGGLVGMQGAMAAPSGGSGGGGGGAFHGDGGDGTTGDTVMVAGGVGGMRVAQSPTVIRGGCAGGGSGTAGGSEVISPATSATFAAGGAGGGAIELSALMSISVASGGIVNAGGAGGGGAPQGSAVGGGGGGSGGYIRVEAPMITLAGMLSANGGAGGGSAPYANQGNQGSNALTASQAAGGSSFGGGNCGLPGAAGSVGGLFNGPDALGADSCGGGGGGGGAGFIFVAAGTLAGQPVISPTVTP